MVRITLSSFLILAGAALLTGCNDVKDFKIEPVVWATPTAKPTAKPTARPILRPIRKPKPSPSPSPTPTPEIRVIFNDAEARFMNGQWKWCDELEQMQTRFHAHPDAAHLKEYGDLVDRIWHQRRKLGRVGGRMEIADGWLMKGLRTLRAGIRLRRAGQVKTGASKMWESADYFQACGESVFNQERVF